MRVVFQYAAGDWLSGRLSELSAQGLQVRLSDAVTADQLAADLGSADVLWHVLHPITDKLIRAAENLRLIQKIGVGVNTIDLETAAARDVAATKS